LAPNVSIPVSRPYITSQDKNAVIEALELGWVSGEGPVVAKFENNLATTFQKKYAVSCSNGTAAIDLAVASLGLVEGDRVICPSFTIGSCCFELMRRRITIDFIDCELDTFNPMEEEYLNAITCQTKAIIIPHIYGFCVDVPRIRKSLGSSDIKIIEDCAESQFLHYPSGGMVGTEADIVTYSFYSNKTVVAGEGGAVLCDDLNLFHLLQSYRNLCFAENRRFFHTDIGWNYRLSSLNAALADSQLARGKETSQKKKDIGKLYHAQLSEVSEIYIPPPRIKNRENGYWVVPIVLKNGTRKTRASLIKYLQSYGIGTRPFFEALHLQNTFRFSEVTLQLPNSESLSDTGFYIPSFVGISEQEISFVIEKIKNYFGF
jgi:perosamine synthetase